jgi:hypothetical protein
MLIWHRTISRSKPNFQLITTKFTFKSAGTKYRRSVPFQSVSLIFNNDIKLISIDKKISLHSLKIPNQSSYTDSDCIRGIPHRVIATCFQRWSKIMTDTNLKTTAMRKQLWQQWLITHNTDWYQQGTDELIPRSDKCLSYGRDYVETNRMAVQLSVNCSY